MDPRRYGARVSAKVSRIYPRRDAAEFSLIKYVIDETELPVLGICRGIQSINAVMGGDLIVDLPEEGYLIHGMANIYPRTEEAHDVRIEKDSKLFGILGKEELGVNSYHHQAVRRIAPGFRATAYSIPDGVIEAMETPGDRFVVGVQWHPEEMIRHEEQQELFRALVREAAKAMHR